MTSAFARRNTFPASTPWWRSSEKVAGVGQEVGQSKLAKVMLLLPSAPGTHEVLGK